VLDNLHAVRQFVDLELIGFENLVQLLGQIECMTGIGKSDFLILGTGIVNQVIQLADIDRLALLKDGLGLEDLLHVIPAVKVFVNDRWLRS
jgi:hypothetical protein